MDAHCSSANYFSGAASEEIAHVNIVLSGISHSSEVEELLGAGFYIPVVIVIAPTIRAGKVRSVRISINGVADPLPGVAAEVPNHISAG